MHTHPETGSSNTPGFLFKHCADPMFQVRFRWKKTDVALWDNRCLQHHALRDYWPNERKGHRVTIKGDRPFLKA